MRRDRHDLIMFLAPEHKESLRQEGMLSLSIQRPDLASRQNVLTPLPKQPCTSPLISDIIYHVFIH
jgi:hypothetical protein